MQPNQTEAHYRQILDSAKHFAIISTDLQGRVTSWNSGAQHVLGWAEDDMLGQPLHRIFTPEDVARGRPEAEMRCALAQGYATDECWHLRRSGERFWAVGELTPLKNACGEVIGFSKVLRDRTEQKEAQSRLQELTAKLKSLVAERTRERDRIWRNSLDLLLVIDSDGVLRDVNPAWQTLLGYEPADLIQHHFQPFVHPEDVAATFDMIGRAAQAPVANFDMRIRHKNGQYRHFAWSAVPEDDCIYASGRDITVEKRQAELLRLQNQARLRMALEAGQMGAWEWDMRSGEVLLLHGADLLHGFPPSAEPIRYPSMAAYAEVVHPEDRQRFADVVNKAIKRGLEHQVEYRIIWPDGRVQWLEARGTITVDEHGKPMQMSGVSVNITRRKRAEQDLAFLARASEELARLVDPQSTLDKLARLAVPSFADWCAVDLLRDDGALERVSVAHAEPQKVKLAHELRQRYPPRPGSLGRTWKIVRSGEPVLVPEITSAMLAESITDTEQLIAVRDLGLRSYIGVPLLAHGKVMGVVTFISAESGRRYGAEDLNLAVDLAGRAAVAVENAKLYLALQQADRDKDVFLATLAHELRNPLAAIANGVSILQLAADDKERVRQSTQVMERQVGQLSRLVDDLLDISRITTGKVELRKERVNLASILSNAIEVSRPLIEAAQHQLILDMADEPADLHADPTRLTQVFANLLNNAAKYTNPQGRIEVSLDCMASECVVRVRDNGIGIAAETMPHIFTMFSQASHPLERSHGGLGIGLSLAERLVKMHGGSVSAHSEGPGRGSEFVVRLPRAAPDCPQDDGPRAAMPQADARWWSTQRVLVVDDNEDAAQTIAQVLRLLGSDVATAHHGLEAVEAARTMRPDIVLLDIGLPGIDGYEAARRIRGAQNAAQDGGHRPLLVALTGWGQEQDRRSALQAGFDHHWVKPVSLEQLKQLHSLANGRKG